MQFPQNSNLFSFQSVLWYLLIAAASFLIFPPQVAYYVVPAILVSAKIWEKVEEIRRLNQESEERVALVSNALAGNLVALVQLQERQISLSEEQQIEVLMQAHENKKSEVINFFQHNCFKISFEKAYFVLRDHPKDISLSYLFLEQFVDESSELRTAYLKNWLPLLIDQGPQIVDNFFRLNLEVVFQAIFELDDENSIEKNRLINLLDRNQIVILKDISVLTNVMKQKSISAVLLMHFNPLFASGQIDPICVIDQIRSRCLFDSTKLPNSGLLEAILET